MKLVEREEKKGIMVRDSCQMFAIIIISNLYLIALECAVISKILLKRRQLMIFYLTEKRSTQILLFCSCKKNHELQCKWYHVKCKHLNSFLLTSIHFWGHFFRR